MTISLGDLLDDMVDAPTPPLHLKAEPALTDEELAELKALESYLANPDQKRIRRGSKPPMCKREGCTKFSKRGLYCSVKCQTADAKRIESHLDPTWSGPYIARINLLVIEGEVEWTIKTHEEHVELRRAIMAGELGRISVEYWPL